MACSEEHLPCAISPAGLAGNGGASTPPKRGDVVFVVGSGSI